MKRKPAVAGYFYPAGKRQLHEMLAALTEPETEKERAVAVVSPHAGYVYSGSVAGAVFSSVLIPETCIILGPSHRGTRTLFAVAAEGFWETPLGEVGLDSDLAALLLKESSLLREDFKAHEGEHSLEVQVPFLQYWRREVSIVPVCVSARASFEELEELGRAVAEAVRKDLRDVLIIASTDMSHYIDQESAKKKDFIAIQKILELDPQGLHETVKNEGISMCGFQPTTAALVAALLLGARRADLVKYQTSGDVSGETHQVVGYAGLRIL